MAKTTIRKMKKAEEDYRSILVQYKEIRCEVERLNEELNNAYSNRSGLGYTGKSSSSSKVSKEMKFVKAKEPSTPLVDKLKF